MRRIILNRNGHGKLFSYSIPRDEFISRLSECADGRRTDYLDHNAIMHLMHEIRVQGEQRLPNKSTLAIAVRKGRSAVGKGTGRVQTQREIATAIGISLRTLQEWRKSGIIDTSEARSKPYKGYEIGVIVGQLEQWLLKTLHKIEV